MQKTSNQEVTPRHTASRPWAFQEDTNAAIAAIAKADAAKKAAEDEASAAEAAEATMKTASSLLPLFSLEESNQISRTSFPPHSALQGCKT